MVSKGSFVLLEQRFAKSLECFVDKRGQGLIKKPPISERLFLVHGSANFLKDQVFAAAGESYYGAAGAAGAGAGAAVA